MTSIVALIPARAGSKRIPGKNTKLLAGHPLIAYTIGAAKRSGVFGNINVCTDDPEAMSIAREMSVGALPRRQSRDDERDFEWVECALDGRHWAAFAILRPTSPFRTAETIREAWAQFNGPVRLWDSLRAMELCRQHPAKMWRCDAGRATPLLLQPTGQPWHSSPTQTLPKVYVQNASLEIAWTETVRRTGTIAGERILAFETGKWEGFDINTIEDWWVAERAIAEGVATLPEVN